MNVLAKQREWVTSPLIDVATLKRGYDLPVQDRSDGPHPIFAANGTVGFHVNAKCRGPGVVTGRSGTIGKVHFVESDFWPLNTSLYVTDFHGNDPKWVYYMLQSFGLERFSQGAGVPTLNRNLIHGEPIRVPTVPEQRRIAAILDQADALRAKRRKALAQLDKLTQSIFVEMFGDPVQNPRGWPILPFGSQFESVRYGTGSPPPYVESGIPFIRATNIKAGRVNAKDLKCISSDEAKKLAKCRVHRGNIIVVRSGVNTGDCAVIPTEYDGSCAAFDLIVDIDYLDAVFFAFLINSEYGRRILEPLTRRAAQPHLNAEQLRSLPLMTPPEELRRKFAYRMDAVDAIRVNHFSALSELDTLFASLQHRAFRGEL